MDEELENFIKAAAERNPDLVAKFGNPLDKDDPRNWTPTKRVEEGLSTEEQLRLLGLDMEQQAMGFASVVQKIIDLEFQLDKLQKWAAAKMAEEFVALAKESPEKALEYMAKMINAGESAPNPGNRGPLENNPDANIRYAGSAKGIAPDQMIETPDGIIRADQIPGYRNDPEWTPSPDWADANCMCPTHVAAREKAKNENPFGEEGFGGTGMYL